MKKIISIVSVLALSCACIFAATYDGRTSVGINYSFDYGVNGFGLTTDTVGYINDAPVGYYVGTDADFTIGDVSLWNINMIVGPAYSYEFEGTNVSFEVAGGLSASTTSFELFSFGVGAYAGAAWSFSDSAELLLGAKMGSNFVNIPLNNPSVYTSGDFYITPQLAIGFNY